MPENELEELEDNLWCHNHTHDDHVHHENEEVVDKFKFKKSILFNNTTLLVNKNHLDFNYLKITTATMIKCSTCNFTIGYKNRKHLDYIYLWRSNVLIDDYNLKFDLFSLCKQGRYVIEVKSENAKKLFIFVHILTCDLLYECCQLTHNDASRSLNFNKRWKKLLYKVYDNQNDVELRNKWFNDINVEFISISYFCYIQALKKLVASTKSLPHSQQMLKNGFFVAIV